MRKLDWRLGLKNKPTTQMKLPRGIRERRGFWHYRFAIQGHQYSGNTGLEARPHLLNDALEYRALERQRILKGGQAAPTIQPFSEAVWDFLEWAKGEYRKSRDTEGREAVPSSWKRIKASLSSARTFFRNEPVYHLTAGRIEAYKTWRRTNYIQEVTIRHDLHNLSLFFQYALKQRWCSDNPARGPRLGGLVEIPSDQDAVRMHVLTESEEAAYFEAALRVSLDLYHIGRLMILQGCRPEELMALEQEHVDIAKGTLRIVRGKSAAAKRTLHLYDESVDILRQRKTGKSRWVFPSPRKPGHHIAKLVNPHNAVLAETGLELVLYDLRHTVATRWVEAGIDLPTVAAWLGHSSLRCIMKYVHIRSEHLKTSQQKYQVELDRKQKLDRRSTFGPEQPSKIRKIG